jgi:hypothetical protein
MQADARAPCALLPGRPVPLRRLLGGGRQHSKCPRRRREAFVLLEGPWLEELRAAAREELIEARLATLLRRWAWHERGRSRTVARTSRGDRPPPARRRQSCYVLSIGRARTGRNGLPHPWAARGLRPGTAA